ncbi:MAG: amino acid dehydrogenase [Rhodospirillales bacterium]|nr:amino acid dehydrogenase [Rhodospirillales bacterium]
METSGHGPKEVNLINYQTLVIPGFEKILRCRDPASGLRAVIAVHDTTLGPAMGGCRMWRYASEDDALADAQRLARGMTFKAALAGLPLGGGKAVIIGDPRRDKSPELFRAFGRAVEHLHGTYVTGEDVGTSVEDMDEVRRETRHVAGVADGSGDPSPMTALGVLHGIRAAVRHRYGADSLDGFTVAVQGLGHVGFHLCRLLHDAGAQLIVSDVAADRMQRAVSAFGAVPVEPEAIAGVEVFAPCALGGAISGATRRRLKAGVIAGAANNQLETPGDGMALHRDRVLYAPDYVINAGGLISVAWDILRRGESYDRAAVSAEVAKIGDRLDAIFKVSARTNRPPEQVADAKARECLAVPAVA